MPFGNSTTTLSTLPRVVDRQIGTTQPLNGWTGSVMVTGAVCSVVERRGEPDLQVELSAIEHGEVHEELDEEAAFTVADLVEPGGERRGSKLGQRGHSGVFHVSL
jgi:hypothetical protein